MANLHVGKSYVLELDQNEAEVILMLTGPVDDDSPVGKYTGRIWDALDTAARGERTDYIIDGKKYDAEVYISEEE